MLLTRASFSTALDVAEWCIQSGCSWPDEYFHRWNNAVNYSIGMFPERYPRSSRWRITDQLWSCSFLPVQQRMHHRALECRVLYHRDDRCALLERNEHRWQLVDRRVLCRQRRASTPVWRETGRIDNQRNRQIKLASKWDGLGINETWSVLSS